MTLMSWSWWRNCRIHGRRPPKPWVLSMSPGSPGSRRGPSWPSRWRRWTLLSWGCPPAPGSSLPARSSPREFCRRSRTGSRPWNLGSVTARPPCSAPPASETISPLESPVRMDRSNAARTSCFLEPLLSRCLLILLRPQQKQLPTASTPCPKSAP